MPDETRHDEPAKEAVEHLHNAAVEMIRATRAFLDLAEDLLADPAPLLGALDLLNGLAAKGRAAAGAGHGHGHGQGQGQGQGQGHSARSGQDAPPVQHIRVS